MSKVRVPWCYVLCILLTSSFTHIRTVIPHAIRSLPSHAEFRDKISSPSLVSRDNGGSSDLLKISLSNIELIGGLVWSAKGLTMDR